VQYAPYGTVSNRTGSTNTPFLLHGALGVMSDSNGLAYMRARYYNPRLMRFVNADPIGFAGGMNAYAFGENNPTGFVDPSGLDPERGIAGMDFVSGTSLIPNETAMAHEDGFVLNGSNYTGSQYALSTFKQDHPIMAFFGFSSMGESDNFAEAHGLDPLFALTGFAGFLEGFGGSTAAAEEGQMLYRGVPGNGTQKAILGEQGIAIPRGAALDNESLTLHVQGADVNAGVTSWTTDRSVAAQRFAGPNGTVIEVPMSQVESQIVPRPNVPKYGSEQEVLLKGTIRGTPTKP